MDTVRLSVFRRQLMGARAKTMRECEVGLLEYQNSIATRVPLKLPAFTYAAVLDFFTNVVGLPDP
eukprot:9237437-Pyramimonas_sp.AAC.1